jgi:hypothetical protein
VVYFCSGAHKSQVVIDVRDLSSEEKQQILYNHIKLGKQDNVFRTAIKPHLPNIAAHSRFIPETARRLADPLFTAELGINRYDLNDFVEKQEHFLQEVLRGLDEHSKAALALIYMRNDLLESPVVLEESEREAIERLGSSIGGCLAGLEALNGSLVQFAQAEGTAAWRFKHPTVGDAYAGLLLESPELLGIYVHGSPIDKLLGQVTCGDVGLERTVALSKGLFPLVIKRLDEVSSTTRYKSPILAQWFNRGRVDDFLASRCSKDFLTQYINGHPDVFDRVANPGLFLSSVSEVDLAIRLKELAILPEVHRRAFVKTVISYAIDGEDLYALESLRIQSVFTPAELTAFRARVRSELIPRLPDVRQSWQSNRTSDQDPEEHIGPLLESLKALKQEFVADPSLEKKIDTEIALARQWIVEETEEAPKTDRPPRTFGDVDSLDQPPLQARGIFDDIDE